MRIAAGLVVAVMAVGATMTGAFAQDATSASDKKVVFTYGTANDIDSFNPLVAVESPAYMSFSLQYNLLLDFSTDDLSPVPGVASEVPTVDNGGISSDGLTWTFKIREGMKWSDGVPLTAHDVAFTFNYIIDNHFGCCVSYLKFVDSVTAPDDTTLIIHTTQPAVGMLSIYNYILPEHIWKDIDKEEAKTFENFDPESGAPVTSGPFRLSNWDKGQSWTFDANPDYWAGAPKVDQIVVKVYQNYDAVVAALRSGEIDFADSLPANLFNSLQDQPDIATNKAVAAQFVSLGINTGSNGPGGTLPDSDANKSLADPVLREALAMAVDKQTLVDKVALGYATVGSTVVPPTAQAFHLEPTDPIPFDIAGANALLDGAGYTDTDDNDIRNDPTTGEDLSFRLFTRTEREDTQTSAEFIIDWWKQIGVEAKQTAVSDTKLTNVIYDGNYDMFIWGWIPDADPDFILSVLSCDQRPPKGYWSDTFYCDATYDANYLKQKTLLNLEERIALIKEMQQQVYDDVPYIVLYYDNVLQAYRSDKWEGFVEQPAADGDAHWDLLAGYGPFSFVSIRSIETAESGGGGSSTGIIIGVVIVALLIGGGFALLSRRKDSEADRA